jgi:hypothetical protein
MARNRIVPQQIQLRVAIRYRVGRALGKFGTVRRNRAPNALSARRSISCRAQLRHITGRLIDEADAEETAGLK